VAAFGQPEKHSPKAFLNARPRKLAVVPGKVLICAGGGSRLDGRIGQHPLESRQRKRWDKRIAKA